MTALAPPLQAFFTERLQRQRGASPHTIAAYRDTFRLLLPFAAAQVHRAPSALDLADLDAPLIGAFLDHLERDRHNSVRTRNHRLAAIHALFQYLALRHPEQAGSIQRVLAIPTKRLQQHLVSYLTDAEVAALLAACETTTWVGRRDRAWLHLAIQTGLRVSELINLLVGDVVLGTGAHVHCVGKGRKERRTPLLRSTVALLKPWLAERQGQPTDPLFPSRTGQRLSRDALEHRLAHYVTTASVGCRSLHGKRVSVHTLRHTAAMRLLHAGVDTAVIALWLGHEQVATTAIYLHADLTLKEQALDRTRPLDAKPGRYRPSDALLAFLEAL